jgi:hypothetical protein
MLFYLLTGRLQNIRYNQVKMDKKTTKAIREIVFQLKQKVITDINAFMGFDACIDTIVRVIKDKKENNNSEFYSNSRQFGEFLISRESKSCGIELHTQQSKIGGNMVITANALGNLGIKADCVGTFGLPDILPVFRTMSTNCSLYTVGDTITTTALEFNDAKVMMFDLGPYNKLNWDGIIDILGIDRIRHLLSGKQLVSFLNWSEIENSSKIWKGILEEILPSTIPSETHPIFFTDFSDCTRRSKEEIRSAINLLGFFRKYFRVIFSMNQNEAELIANALDLNVYNSDEDLVKILFIACKVDEIVIHRTKDALAFDGVTFEKCASFFCKGPTILTGGGDNFNAGYCFSKFHGFNLYQSLIVANAVSGYYVRTGSSPDVRRLIEFLQQN